MNEHTQSDFEKLSDYRWGLADEATRREVEAKLAEPNSPMKALLDQMDAATRHWLRGLAEPRSVVDSGSNRQPPASVDPSSHPELADTAQEKAPDARPER